MVDKRLTQLLPVVMAGIDSRLPAHIRVDVGGDRRPGGEVTVRFWQDETTSALLQGGELDALPPGVRLCFAKLPAPLVPLQPEGEGERLERLIRQLSAVA